MTQRRRILTHRQPLCVELRFLCHLWSISPLQTRAAPLLELTSQSASKNLLPLSLSHKFGGRGFLDTG